MKKTPGCASTPLERLAERCRAYASDHGAVVPPPPPPRNRPRTLEEAKLMFRISVEAATMGPLRHLTVCRMMWIAFGAGAILGAFPKARRALGSAIFKRLTHPE